VDCIGLDLDDAIANNLLPIWCTEGLTGDTVYHVPEELACLIDAEKMLIQMMSPFIPCHHIKNETFGLKGHGYCFPQLLGDVCKVLSHLPSDITLITMIHTYKHEIQGSRSKAFLIHKLIVLQALHGFKDTQQSIPRHHHKAFQFRLD
jgi:hypothetical protein